MSSVSRHTEWLSLVEVSGAFLALPVLEKAFPQGLDIIETPRRQRLRAAYEEWRDAVDEDDPLLPELHREWIRLVFKEILEYDAEVLKNDTADVASYFVVSPERTDTFTPDWVVVSPSDAQPRLFVSLQPPNTDLEKVRKGDRWPASLRERMTALCRVHGVRLGLITDGERWMLVNAPSGATSGDASWYARLWFQEPVTLKAFQSLLGVRRCFGPLEETLDALLEKSLEHHEEVTDTLGEQVRRAVEVLVQCLDKADADRNRELLRDVAPAELYEVGLTVMMRLVFVLCAEERGLLLSGDPVYDECYAVSTLRGQLAEEADRHGPEILERRHDAWARLLSVFRAVHGGIEHESLRMPALGGSLFDPDRFPFLEGRPKGTTWRDSDATPLPIDNRTVLLLLNSLQSLEQHGGALLLSYRALDVEQIGHVYEGLLEHTAARVPTVTLGLAGSKNAKNPNLPLSELESARMAGDEILIALAMETTERSQSAICNALTRLPEEVAFGRLLSVCGGDTVLAERIRPFVNLLRTDAWDDPIVYRGNAFMITLGVDRRETGTHYTPKSRTESIVQTTLEPVVYVGPAEGKPREEWRLRRPGELLDLKICDLGMGSGAFLVQTCRWLAERLVEAWATEEATGKFITADGDVLENVDDFDPMPLDMEERLLMARRLIAERCLYGVDVNPLAVELTKLSIWLVTLAKGRPFGFLDHNLRHGDSLLGIHCLDQLIKLKMNPDYSPHQQYIFGQNIEKAVVEAVEIRKRLRSIPICDIRDVEMMTQLNKEARDKLQVVKLVADAMIGQALRSSGNTRILDSALESLVMEVDEFLNGNEKMGLSIAEKARIALSVDLPNGKPLRKPFHWPLEFPEVFAASSSGFSGIVGNPPFMYGKNISGNFGESYSNYLLSIHPWSSKNADLCVHFFLRSFNLLQIDNSMGLLATKTIAEGDSRESGLEWITSNGGEIFAAFPNEPWPGRAAVITSRVHVIKGSWHGLRRLMSSKVDFISSYLTDQKLCTPKPLKENMGIAFQGSTILGEGHILTKTEALSLIDHDERNKKVLFPYLNGDELNSDSQQQPSRWVINFYDWEEHCAAGYTKVYELLKDRAYPDRLEKSKKKSYKTIMKSWWQYWRPRSDLYHAIGRGHDYRNHIKGWDPKISQFDRVLVIARTSKTGAFVFIPNSYVMSDAMVVFARSDYLFFSILQSNIHVAYAWQYSSKLKADLRYSHSDCFETFPFPKKSKCNKFLEKIGEQFHSTRDAFLKANRVGVTGFYQRFHNHEDKDPELNNLRDLQITIDKEVLKAYEFEDIDPGHSFHTVAYLPEEDRIRFTISEQARLEVLHRLARLNDVRYKMETSADYMDRV